MEVNSLISVIIPTYNRANYIGETLNSIIAQTHSNWECIIVDDGSTDNTKMQLEAILKTEQRFRYVFIQNSGPSKAREVGLKSAIGDFIQFLDSDDLIPNNRFKKCVESIEEFDFLVTNFDRFKKVREPFIPPYCTLSQNLLNLNSIVLEWDKDFTIPIHCGFFKTEIFQKVKMQTTLHMYEDWLMWIDIFLNGFFGKYINETLAHYRFSHESLSFDLARRTRIVAEAYFYIYQKIPQELQSDFFRVIIDELCGELAECYENRSASAVIQSTVLSKALGRLKSIIK